MIACRLREAIQSAAEQASSGSATSSSSSTAAGDRDRGPSAKHLKPIVTAVEMVFGSAAALSATFGFKVHSSAKKMHLPHVNSVRHRNVV